ncbi:facilitated trehalose transporter Tret1-like [Athalia rosae]|uniref:facilitated trehalose transporter Tret1-like n=1 Tax=Athalia rosae TaxID=37344 RepID=UPI0020341C76|nr:facilitated trehalose transporter Tret1-like [Athalia rosae]
MAQDSEKGNYKSPEGSHKYEYAVTFVCFIVVFGIGTEFGFNSPLISVLTAPNTPINVTASELSTIAAAVVGGQMVTPVLTLCMDKVGRKPILFGFAVSIVISWTMVAIANGVLVLTVGRLVGGFAMGVGLMISPIYLSEVTSAKLRGTLGLMIPIGASCGMLFTYMIIPYLKFYNSVYVLLSLGVAATIALCFIPESPYFLAMKGRIEEAEEVLEKLRGKTDVAEELETVKEAVTKQREQMNRDERDGIGRKVLKIIKEIALVRANRRAFLVNVSFVMMIHGGGYMMVLAFAPQIVNAMKVEINEYMINIILAVIQLVCSCVTSFVIDKFGRRALSITAGIVCSASTLIITIYFCLLENLEIDVSAYSGFALFAMTIFVVAMTTGITSVQFVIISETLASEIKIAINLIIAIGGGLVATVTVKGFILVTMIWKLGHALPFAVCFLILCVCVTTIHRLLPETKGRTFVEIQKAFNA